MAYKEFLSAPKITDDEDEPQERTKFSTTSPGPSHLSTHAVCPKLDRIHLDREIDVLLNTGATHADAIMLCNAHYVNLVQGEPKPKQRQKDKFYSAFFFFRRTHSSRRTKNARKNARNSGSSKKVKSRDPVHAHNVAHM